MDWKVPKIWEGGDVWILGGGASVVQQFQVPNEIVQKVLSRKLPVSAYSPYFQPIHDKHVIGINAAYLIGTWMDMVFFGDSGFFTDNKDQLFKFPHLKVSSNSSTRKYAWVKTLKRDAKKHGISEDSSRVCWNDNSGSAAISIAVNAGAKRVFLLGFDMKLDEKNVQHWHKLYKKNQMQKVPHPPFNKHLAGFPKIAEDAKKMNVEIYNVSPDSVITQFPKITLQEALEL